MSPRCLELLSDYITISSVYNLIRNEVKRTALEGNVSLRYLEDDRTLRLSIVTTGLAAEVRPGLLRSLEAKDAYRLHQPERTNQFAIRIVQTGGTAYVLCAKEQNSL